MARTETAPYLPLHPKIGYEHSDANTRHIVLIGVGILGGAWISVGLLYFFFAFLAQRRAETTLPPPREAGRTLLPPQPRIQVSPAGDLTAFRAYEDRELGGYRWANRTAGTVSLPIDLAIELTAQRGIPPQKAPAALKLYPPKAGTRRTGFEGKVEPEPR